MSQQYITIRGAKVHNLKNVNVDLPRNQFIVITGVSGSGKSSLAFDTLYAEGRRRYIESLSAYARQFMGKLTKPETDGIKGLPPAIAIEQKVNTRNPRSTVGTSTEIYDYLRMLFGRVGHTFSPVSGCEVLKHTIDDVVNRALTYPDGTRIAIVAPITIGDSDLSHRLNVYLQEGFTRLYDDGAFVDIADYAANAVKGDAALPMLLIDRLMVTHRGDELSRLADSVETAFFEGHDACSLLVWDDNGGDAPARFDFSKRFEADGITFIEPSEQLFNFNNPYGACPVCEGFGQALGIAEDLVIPNKRLSIYDDAVAPWRGPMMSECKREFIRRAEPKGFPIHRPYYRLTDEQRRMLWDGIDGEYGINDFFAWVEKQRHKIQYRVMMARYRAKTTCPKCHGSRLRPEAAYVKVGGLTIAELVKKPVKELLRWFDALTLSEADSKVARRLLIEIKQRLTFLDNVGLGYLTLDRLSNTLSGGESQRINLATSLGSPLVGSLYILDEPSIGLHPHDTQRLIEVLRQLQRLGNTVVVVEHDAEIMHAADYIIDVGPAAGRLGGNIIYQGPAADIANAASVSLTAQYLSGKLVIDTPPARRRSSKYIEVVGARHHNLRDITVRFPLGIMTVVTGVSGSGKSTLVRDILYKAMARQLEIDNSVPGEFERLDGDLRCIADVVFVDQNPIGKSSRSNPATYLKAYDEIRQVFAEQPLARQLGLSAAFFSFNTEGGRCEQCKGDGTITIPMQFLADVTITCDACHGRRFKRDILQVRYHGLNISEVLDLTVNQAIEFFTQSGDMRVVRRLRPLADVGLGYITLGQTSSTLSGGENQRVKLAYHLAEERPKPTLFIFDEPTTGLHFHDIATLLRSFDKLLAQGHTLVIIEHNTDIIRSADYVIDMGPEAGDGGGTIVATGTPEQIAANPDSITGRYLSLDGAR